MARARERAGLGAMVVHKRLTCTFVGHGARRCGIGGPIVLETMLASRSSHGRKL